MSTPRRSFRERWLLGRILWAEYRRRNARALRLLGRLEALGPLKLHERALKAKLLLLTGEPERAHDLFVDVRDQAAVRGDAVGDYIRRYAEFWHAHIRWDPFNARAARRAADQIECDPRLKRLLWIYPDAPDPLDLEFDGGVDANPPGPEAFRKRSSRPEGE